MTKSFQIGLPYTTALLSSSLMLGLAGSALSQSAPWDSPLVTGQQIAQISNTLLEIQRELNRRGYDAGPVDGWMGARTRAAIQDYQREHKLLVNGQPTSSLLAHLRDTTRSGGPAFTPSEPEASSQQLADIQSTLRARGYAVGYRSGRLTDELRAAILSYESDHGLLASGQPSAELLQHLRRGVKAAPQSAVVEAVDGNTIASIQTELRLRGYPIPRVTGEMDAPTRQAIREYQEGQGGVVVSGQPSAVLLAELRTASSEPVAAALTREQRAAAQRVLNARGYDAGPADGVLGPRSRGAIEAFQNDHALRTDGELNSRTMARLGLATTAALEPPAVATRGYQVRVRDDFADGDHTRNPTWQVAVGHFEVRNGGLHSTTLPPSEQPANMGRQMLSELLQRQLGFALPGGEIAAAAAYLPIEIDPEFKITTVVSGSAEGHSHLDLGLYQGDKLNHGYRFNYRISEPRPLQLVVVNESGVSLIASAKLPPDNDRALRLVWERNAEGRMTVTHNERILMDVVDSSVSGRFNGFSLINAGGEWTLYELIVEDRD